MDKELILKRIKHTIGILSTNIHEEEDDALAYYGQKDNLKDINFSTSFVIASETQIYRTLSIMGILKYFDIDLTFKVISFGNLLNIWYNESDSCSRDDLLTCDILIIQGKTSRKARDSKDEAMSQIIEERNIYGRKTWIFFKDTTLNKVKLLYPETIGTVSNIYTSKI